MPDARHEHDRRVGATHRRAVRAGVALVVGGVRRAVVRVQLAQAGDHLLDGCRAGQVEHHRRHLGAQEVVGARRAQRGQRLQLLAGHEVEHDVAVGEVADHPQVGRGQATDHRGERGRLGAAVGLGQRLVAGDHRAERVGLAVLGDVGLGGADDVERVGLALPRRVPPGRDAVAAEDAADRLRVGALDLGDVEAELEAGTAPGHPDDAVAEDLLREGLAVGRRRDRDAGVGVEVVDVGGVDESVHGRVDRGGRAAGAEEAVVEGRDHLVLALHAGVDVDEGAHPVQAQHREAGLLQGAEVAAGALDPHQLGRLGRHRVDGLALGGGVAAGVVRGAGVRAEPVGALDELRGGRRAVWAVTVSSILPGRRRRGPPRSIPGSRCRHRPARGSRAARAPRATRRGRGARRCRRRP